MKRLILIAVILATGMMVSVENGFSAYVVNPMEADLNGGAYDINNVTNLEATSVVTTNITTNNSLCFIFCCHRWYWSN